jgi:hypothetical protein
MQCAIIQSNFSLGNIAEGCPEFKKFNNEFPKSGRGYIEYGIY